MQPVQLEDQQKAGDDFARGHEFAQRFGHRTILAVPLVREDASMGCILVRRTEVQAFDQNEIALLTTFADQAAIAIENVRLFEAEQQRTHQLSESLEQQTATSEVLKIISRSTFDLQSVLNRLVEVSRAAVRCGYGIGSPTEGPRLPSCCYSRCAKRVQRVYAKSSNRTKPRNDCRAGVAGRQARPCRRRSSRPGIYHDRNLATDWFPYFPWRAAAARRKPDWHHHSRPHNGAAVHR